MPPYYQLMKHINYFEIGVALATSEPVFKICGLCGYEYEVTEGCVNCYDDNELPSEAYDANDDFDHSRWL